MRFERQLVLLAGISILGLHSAHLFKVSNRVLKLSKACVRLTAAIETFDVGWVELDCFTCVEKRKLEFFHFKTGKRAIAIVYSLFGVGYFAENGLRVLFYRVCKLVI